jgi:phosphatidylglycerophosphatase A
MNSVAIVVATAGGAGYAPIAPGTAGSLVGLVIYLLTRHSPIEWQIGLFVAIVVAGTWASSRVESVFGEKDPGPVVIDEVAGQLATLLFTGASVGAAVVGFFVFRLLDIVKPPPADRFERLPHGYGIMADDLMAGLYGNLVIQVLVRVIPGVW